MIEMRQRGGSQALGFAIARTVKTWPRRAEAMPPKSNFFRIDGSLPLPRHGDQPLRLGAVGHAVEIAVELHFGEAGRTEHLLQLAAGIKPVPETVRLDG